MASYYNELDPYAAQWLRNLIAAGHIADGEVDERSIAAVRPDDLRGFTQCHFFAGIGVWSHALRLAGWTDDRPVWTGSCPCQPFSVAGAGKGTADERHLWPTWFDLIRECRPSVVFGEQVEAALRHGWLDLVQADLEGIGYAVGAIGAPAAGVGAPHIRSRLWFVADAGSERRQQVGRGASRDEVADGRAGWNGQQPDADHVAGSDGESHNVADASPRGLGVDGSAPRATGHAALGDATCGMAHHHHPGLGLERRGGLLDGQRSALGHDADRCESAGRMGDDDDKGLEGRQRSGDVELQRGSQPIRPAGATGDAHRPGPTNGYWGSPDWIFCRDGKWRPIESGLEPLAHGATARVGRLRAYGNAIVPQVAAEVIAAYMDCRP